MKTKSHSSPVYWPADSISTLHWEWTLQVRWHVFRRHLFHYVLKIYRFHNWDIRLWRCDVVESILVCWRWDLKGRWLCGRGHYLCPWIGIVLRHCSSTSFCSFIGDGWLWLRCNQLEHRTKHRIPSFWTITKEHWLPT